MRKEEAGDFDDADAPKSLKTKYDEAPSCRWLRFRRGFTGAPAAFGCRLRVTISRQPRRRHASPSPRARADAALFYDDEERLRFL